MKLDYYDLWAILITGCMFLGFGLPILLVIVLREFGIGF